MKNPIKNHLQKRLPAFLLLSLVVRLLSDVLAVDVIAFRAHDVALHFTVCTLFYFVVKLLPSSLVPLRCTVAAVFGFEIVEGCQSLLCLAGIQTIPYMIAVQCSIALILVLFFLKRSAYDD